jgi:hypothetical protein
VSTIETSLPELGTEGELMAILATGIRSVYQPGAGRARRPPVRRRGAARRVERHRARPPLRRRLVARDLGDGGPDQERRSDFTMTNDRELVTEVAQSMMRRLAA